MGELTKLAEAQSLTDQQLRFVQAVLNGKTNAEALREAGYSQSLLPAHVLRSAAVQAAIKAGCDARLTGDLYLKAINALDALLESGPAATRFAAAKLVIEQRKAAEEDGAKPLSGMTEDELQGVIDRAKERLSAGMIDVTPGNGAHQDEPQP